MFFIVININNLSLTSTIEIYKEHKADLEAGNYLSKLMPTNHVKHPNHKWFIWYVFEYKLMSNIAHNYVSSF